MQLRSLTAIAVSLALTVACSPHQAPVHERVGAAREPINAPAWAIPLWAVDNANGTGCASDTNTCQSTTCGGPSVGPCKTFGEVLSRWGTSSPVTAQVTRIVFLSDDSEPAFDLTPILSLGGTFTVTGTLSTVTSGTLGTVVPKNRATPQLLTANLGQAATGFVGLILSDTTRGTYSWIDSGTSGNVATLSQPFASIVDCATFPFELDTVAGGDSYQVLRPSKVPIRAWNPVLRTQAYFASGTVCLENMWVPDPSGTPGNASFDFNISGEVNQTRVDPNAFVRITNQRQEPAYHYNNFWNGGLQANAMTQNAPGIIGGDIYSSESQGGSIASNGAFILDGDVIIHGFLLMANVSGFTAAAYVKSHLMFMNSTIQLGTNIAPPAIWGPGFLSVGPKTALILESTTATASLLQTGGTFFGDGTNINTGCALDTSVDPSTLRCGRTLTPAHIDGTVASGGFGGAALDPFLNSAITGER